MNLLYELEHLALMHEQENMVLVYLLEEGQKEKFLSVLAMLKPLYSLGKQPQALSLETFLLMYLDYQMAGLF